MFDLRNCILTFTMSLIDLNLELEHNNGGKLASRPRLFYLLSLLISKNFIDFRASPGKDSRFVTMNNKNNFPDDFVQCFFFLFPKQLPTGTVLPCSVLILSMVKNQSDVENLVKNCLKLF